VNDNNVKLDVLNNIDIAAPCPANWHEMTGDAQKRHCEHCDLEVYNLSAMTRREAADLLQRPNGPQCVRLYRRQDGTVITRDCPWHERMKLRSQRWVAAIVGLVGIGWAATVGCIMGARAYESPSVKGHGTPERLVPDCGNPDDQRQVMMGRRRVDLVQGEMTAPRGVQPQFGERYATSPQNQD